MTASSPAPLIPTAPPEPLHFYPMIPAGGRKRTRRNTPKLKTCGCGRQEYSTSGAWRQCSVCRRDQQTKAGAENRARAARARANGEILIREDGWCWSVAERSARLVELSRDLGHSRWAGPVMAEGR